MNVMLYGSLSDAVFERYSYSMSGNIFNTVRLGRLIMPEGFFKAAIVIPLVATVLLHIANLVVSNTVDKAKLKEFYEHRLVDVGIPKPFTSDKEDKWNVIISVRSVLNFILEFLIVYSSFSIVFEIMRPVREHIANRCLVAGKDSMSRFFNFFIDRELSFITALIALNILFDIKKIADKCSEDSSIKVQFSGRKDGLTEKDTAFNIGNFVLVELLSRSVLLPLLSTVYERIVRGFIQTSLKGVVSDGVAFGISFVIGAVIKGIDKIISSLLKEIFPTFVDEKNKQMKDLKASVPIYFFKGVVYRCITTVCDVIIDFCCVNWQVHNLWFISNMMASLIDTIEPEESMVDGCCCR